ncbi:tRNA modification GTPase MnmE protein [Salinisphaera shabanensis E1L3A]|uniref:tRNA modification GTPase MnmE n=1 Tax=Salinisphaera shabanensis E1L3A TaxID=1033802 RepID=U2FWM3_9GAMM|nr:tRNA uridine-5-carboxymethylaminomethyl(34) synthesis GTPase MnmE [Salinisphaera shabanensis]ERJ20294.1 tRNA modification GTPase MnmE protein [Salinisphaera shabanensis E1L3A]
MTSSADDTVAALASGAGRAGVAVVRISGSRVPEIAAALIGGLPSPRQARVCAFVDADGVAIDRGVALYFAAPASFTGEHVLELQGHGSPVLVDMLLARLLELGVRLAEAGEFSRRAFINDKLSLDQAEAIADTIDAGSSAAARAAMRSLEGVFSREVNALVEALIELRVYTEGAIDFPDEDDIDFLGDGEIERRLNAIRQRLETLRGQAAQGASLREGLRLVILGAPNVGKSSLLNRLARRDTAIVTDIAGTTRDVLHEQLSIDGLPLTLVDTAGLRETADPIEAEGVRRAKAEIEHADHVLLVVDDTSGLGCDEQALLAEIGNRCPVTVVANKIDLSGAPAGLRRGQDYEHIGVSATTGAGFDALAAHLKQAAGMNEDATPAFVARRRHLDALSRADAALEIGHERLVVDAAGELLAEELRTAQNALGEITGAFTSDDLLGAIFSSFCIGK